MPKFAQGHNSGKMWHTFFKVNQVFYPTSPISWPSFKTLAQTAFEVLAESLKCPNFQRAITLEKFDRIYSKVNQVICSSSPISWPSLKLLAQIHLERRYLADKTSLIICQRGITPERESITPEREITRTRNKIQVSYFSIRNPYMNFKTLACTVHKYGMHQKVWPPDAHTHALYHRQAKSNMPNQLFSKLGA